MSGTPTTSVISSIIIYCPRNPLYDSLNRNQGYYNRLKLIYSDTKLNFCFICESRYTEQLISNISQMNTFGPLLVQSDTLVLNGSGIADMGECYSSTSQIYAHHRVLSIFVVNTTRITGFTHVIYQVTF